MGIQTNVIATAGPSNYAKEDAGRSQRRASWIYQISPRVKMKPKMATPAQIDELNREDPHDVVRGAVRKSDISGGDESGRWQYEEDSSADRETSACVDLCDIRAVLGND